MLNGPRHRLGARRLLNFETKSDLVANTLDNRRNCRHIHMLDASAMSQPLVCTIRDQKRLQREFELLLAHTANPIQHAKELCERFCDAIRLRHVDWTMESRVPSEHDWIFRYAQVRYRIVPDAEAVEILSVTPSDPKQPRAHE